MSVYVDDMDRRATVPNGARTVTGVWSHMYADTHEELEAMARTIGLRPSWIQHPGTLREHYDVTAPRKAAAIAAGAIPVTWREASRWRSERRKATRALVAEPPATEQLGASITGVWHDEAERFKQTGRLDQGPCWCSDCIAKEQLCQ
ncbi:uncharacterized protein DUF4031 [Rathayibacter sp. PhB151]|uniref:DUF4031 domain-containing protein n=1 Tax=Rathayibacter sp. PhB151 TaxID=2485189 RepID=UPI0010D30BB7|nr:DUF4031 domain-containing protein [Rathayibacter sp. PhB151]TDX78704.1 uncharacterized protein DUF4031 [Rathayibacter sp. PhB151]